MSMIGVLPYFYSDAYLRTPIEGLLAQQYGDETESSDGDNGVRPGQGAISAVLAADLRVNKATATSDDETSLIHSAYIFYRTAGGAAWLRKTIQGQTVLARLDAALTWLFTNRFDAATRLIRRGHTTDWGDVKAEAGGEPTDFDPKGDHWTASIYDQALTYRATRELAAMHRAVGSRSRAKAWERRATDLREHTHTHLWQPAHGFFKLHLHVTPWTHPFDEDSIVSVMNALAVDVGLTTPEQAASIFHNLELARHAAEVLKPGLVLYPPYPAGFLSNQGGYGEYQNGAVWDWWGGMQIVSEFRNGAAALATEHLLQVAADWSRHPGTIFEWQTPQTLAGHGSAHFASAAGTVGEAIVRGLFGVDLSLDALTLQSRLGLRNGNIRVYQASTDRYAAYTQTVTNGMIVLEYGTNATTPVIIKILLPRGMTAPQAQIDGQNVSVSRECVGEDCYAVVVALTGQHRIILSIY